MRACFFPRALRSYARHGVLASAIASSPPPLLPLPGRCFTAPNPEVMPADARSCHHPPAPWGAHTWGSPPSSSPKMPLDAEGRGEGLCFRFVADSLGRSSSTHLRGWLFGADFSADGETFLAALSRLLPSLSCLPCPGPGLGLMGLVLVCKCPQVCELGDTSARRWLFGRYWCLCREVRPCQFDNG